MKPELSTAIIGAGQIAGGFDKNKFPSDDGIFTHAGAYKKSGKFSLDMVFDIDYQKGLKFKDDWNIKNCAQNIEELYDSFFDVVSICTPDFTHYDIIKSLLTKKVCKTIFAEKPLALDLKQISELIELSEKNNINIVVNFQRRFDKFFSITRRNINENTRNILAMNGYYMKGLEHNGITMVDAMIYLCGYPKEILAYNKIYNQEQNDYSYEFILFYDNFNVTVKTIDSPMYRYNYHIFEIDLLFSDKRIIINDNSRLIESKEIVDYAYSGVKVLNDRTTKKTETDYKISFLNIVEYIYNITEQGIANTINTPQSSYNNKLIVDNIIISYDNQKKVDLKEVIWKK